MTTVPKPKRNPASAEVIAHTSKRPFIRGGVPRNGVIGMPFASAREAFIVSAGACAAGRVKVRHCDPQWQRHRERFQSSPAMRPPPTLFWCVGDQAPARRGSTSDTAAALGARSSLRYVAPPVAGELIGREPQTPRQKTMRISTPCCRLCGTTSAGGCTKPWT
jgi:hypothetical protein